MWFLFETCAAVTHFTELLLTVALEACLDLTGLLIYHSWADNQR